MKRIDNTQTLPDWQQYKYSGLEPVYSREFIESEENEENNFYCFAGDVINDPKADKRKLHE